MNTGILNTVNEHFIDHLTKVSEKHCIRASEDIVDARGMKLWAKGQEVSSDMQQKLLMRKLRKPLESSIFVEDGINIAAIGSEAEDLLAKNEVLRQILHPHSDKVLKACKNLILAPGVVALLTAAHDNGSGAFRHAVLASMVATGLALHLRLESQLSLITIAGLLHDIGELYVNPTYLHNPRELTLDQWKHVAIHPHISQVVITELTDYPRAVSLAVGEHHEREDGWGYPRRLSAKEISLPGKIIGVTELLSALLARDNAAARACLALRVIPGEFDHQLISVIANIASAAREGASHVEVDPSQRLETARVAMAKLEEAISVHHTLANSLSQPLKPLHERIEKRLFSLQRGMNTTGIHSCLDNPEICAVASSHDIKLEVDAICREISWRVRDLGRDIMWQLSESGPEARSGFQPLLDALGSA